MHKSGTAPFCFCTGNLLLQFQRNILSHTIFSYIFIFANLISILRFYIFLNLPVILQNLHFCLFIFIFSKAQFRIYFCKTFLNNIFVVTNEHPRKFLRDFDFPKVNFCLFVHANWGDYFTKSEAEYLLFLIYLFIKKLSPRHILDFLDFKKAKYWIFLGESKGKIWRLNVYFYLFSRRRIGVMHKICHIIDIKTNLLTYVNKLFIICHIRRITPVDNFMAGWG